MSFDGKFLIIQILLLEIFIL